VQKKNIPQGSIIHKEDIEFLRPCPKNALPPYFVDKLKGNPASRNIMAGDCFFLSDIN
jgi:N-acetylneuraminate synthase